MALLAVSLFPGILAGWAVGGRLGRLAELELRAPAVIFAALALQLGLGLLPAGARAPALAGSCVLVGVWLLLNVRGRPPVLGLAVGLLAAGWLLNVAVMLPNGGMPVSGAALARIGAPPQTDVSDGHLYKHVPADAETVLPWLADVVPLAPLSAVVSAGDLVLAAGGFLLLATGMARAGTALPAPA